MSTSNPFLAWLRAPTVRSEAQGAKRVLAGGRAFLAIGSLITICADPNVTSPYAAPARVCLLVYALYSPLILMLLRIRRESTPALRLGMHAANILCIVLIFLSTDGPNSPSLFSSFSSYCPQPAVGGLQAAPANVRAGIAPSLFAANLASSGSRHPGGSLWLKVSSYGPGACSCWGTGRDTRQKRFRNLFQFRGFNHSGRGTGLPA